MHAQICQVSTSYNTPSFINKQWLRSFGSARPRVDLVIYTHEWSLARGSAHIDISTTLTRVTTSRDIDHKLRCSIRCAECSIQNPISTLL